MRKFVLLAIAIVAAVIVFFTNESMSSYLKNRSAVGAGALFLLLPLAAFLTRPVAAASVRGKPQRAIGIVYALRERRWGFIFRSVGLWLLATIVLIVLMILLYQDGEITGSAAVANWWYVANALALITHLVPGRLQLRPAKPVTVIVAGGPATGKSSFIGLLPIEETSGEWTFNPTPSTAMLTAQLHARARGAGDVQPTGQIPRSTLVRRRPWTLYSGVRPIPVDFIELRDVLQKQAYANERVAFAVLIPADAGDDGIRLDLQRHLNAARAAGLARQGKMSHPVAVLLTKADLAPIKPGRARNALSKQTADLLDQNCRNWEVFAVTDRSGAAEFSPKGYVEAALWLVESAA